MATDIKYLGNIRTEGHVSGHQQTLISDVEKAFGGLEENLSPTQYFEYSIGACTLSVIGLRAKRLNVNVEGLKATSELEYTHAHQITKVKLTIECPQPVDQKTAESLESYAHQCPVKKAIDPSIPVETVFKWNIK